MGFNPSVIVYPNTQSNDAFGTGANLSASVGPLFTDLGYKRIQSFDNTDKIKLFDPNAGELADFRVGIDPFHKNEKVSVGPFAGLHGYRSEDGIRNGMDMGYQPASVDKPAAVGVSLGVASQFGPVDVSLERRWSRPNNVNQRALDLDGATYDTFTAQTGIDIIKGKTVDWRVGGDYTLLDPEDSQTPSGSDAGVNTQVALNLGKKKNVQLAANGRYSISTGSHYVGLDTSFKF